MDKQRGENKYLVIAHQESKRIAKSLARVTHADAYHLTREEQEDLHQLPFGRTFT